MTLNKISVLDKGFVSMMSVSNSEKTLKDVQDSYYRGSLYKDLSRVATATFIIKCPIFVQLYLASRPEFDLTIFSTPPKEVEAFIPDETDIGSKENSVEIKENMKQTTEALLLNPKAFQHDGCNKFISQVLTPISLYNELIVHGSLYEWIKFLKKNNLPHPVAEYKRVIEDFLRTEWSNLDDYLKN